MLIEISHPVPSSDMEEHRRTFAGVVRVVFIFALLVLSLVVGLAIGGTEHHWMVAGFWMAVALLGAAVGLAFRELGWKPLAVILAMMLATLGIGTG